MLNLHPLECTIKDNDHIPDLLLIKYWGIISCKYHTCIEIEPNFGGAYYNLGYIYGELNNYEQSIYFYNKAVQQNFDLEATLVNLALQEIKANKKASACAHLEEAYQLGRTDIKPLMNKYCK